MTVEEKRAAEKSQGDSAKQNGTDGSAAKTDEKKDKPVVEEELSDDDKKLKEQLDMLVLRLQETNASLYKPSLEALRDIIRSATSSMTSVPKPLKFLKPQYAVLKESYTNHLSNQSGDVKRLACEVLSVLAMTSSSERESLRFKIEGGFGDGDESVGGWGHEYVRHLAGEVTQEWNDATYALSRTEMLPLIKRLIDFFMRHNAEPEACDLLMETEQLEQIKSVVDEHSFNKVCLYLNSCVPYVAGPEDMNLLRTTIDIYRKFGQPTEALRYAIRLQDAALMRDLFLNGAKGTPHAELVQRQMAYMLGHAQVYLKLEESETPDYEKLMEIMTNVHLNSSHLALARELDIAEAKAPDDVFKTYLENSRTPSSAATLDSARQSLANSFVNGFVNCAFGKDTVFTPGVEEGNKWLHKHKDLGMLSATASLGLVLLWDVDNGLTEIDKYLYSQNDDIRGGAMLACGVVNSRIKNECDPALALLTDACLDKSMSVRIGAVIGLGIAYAGTNRSDVIQVLLPAMDDDKSSLDVKALCSISLGLIAVGSCHGDLTERMLNALSNVKPDEPKRSPLFRYLALGLGLLYLSRQDAIDAVREVLTAQLQEPMRSMAQLTLEGCAYANTGNVLKIQQMLHVCREHEQEKPKTDQQDKKDAAAKTAAGAAATATPASGTGVTTRSAAAAAASTSAAATTSATADAEKMDSDDADQAAGDKEPKANLAWKQGIAVINLALIAMGEDIGAEMSLRTFGHLMRYGDAAIRRAVPLALGIVSVSNPRLNVMDTLGKFSHDIDSQVAINSVFALGLIGAGTNNARLASMLRQLAVFHAKDANVLFVVRLAQGLLHFGKGTLGLSPNFSDRQLVSYAGLAGLIITLTACLNIEDTLAKQYHYLLYYLVPSIQPRQLVTLNEQGDSVGVPVRVGQAVDVVGQAGKPKTITGFQTHTTPVLLHAGERAELATDEYAPMTTVLEGFVILRKKTAQEMLMV